MKRTDNTNQPSLRVWLIKPDLATVPRYATRGAAGMDLSAALDEPVVIPAGGQASVPTGLAIALPEGYEGQVRPRSGLAARHAITVLNAPGTVDSDYRGEVRVLLVNLGVDPYQINPGDRIAQLVVAPVTRVDVKIVEDTESLGYTARGSGGFGSTGN
ncbi:MAG: dUTP diphosphatase [Deltaproteobacteria bacterium]|nr:dUTP diphosphatase [Deltaproteobacteria bacterium]